MSWSLFIRHGGQTVERALVSETKVGRDPACQIRIRHPTVSRHHFTVFVEGDALRLEHAHPKTENPRGSWVSINTFVNGVQVMADTSLAAEDVITLKPDPGEDGVVVRVGPSVSPQEPAADKPWWKLW